MGATSVDGLVSGLDTTTIINQLMAIERQPVDGLTTRKATYDARATAWGQIGSSVAALRTALEALDNPSDLKAFNASTTNIGVVSASASASAVPGSFTMQVNRLATAHQLISAKFTAPSTVVGAGTFWASSGIDALGSTTGTTLSVEDGFTAGAHTVVVRAASGGGMEAVLDDGTPVPLAAPVAGAPWTATFTSPEGKHLTLTFAGTPTTGTAKISVANLTATNTVTDLATAISTSGGPARAQVVNPGGADGARLILTASATGTANALTTGWSGTNPVTLTTSDPQNLGLVGLDAEVEIPGIGTATRSSNTIIDLVPGVTLNLVKQDVNPVTVSVAPDVNGAVGKVQALVNALNGVVGSLQKNTAYDAASNKGGALLGDSTARNLSSSLADTVGGLLGSGAYKLFSQLGVNLNKDGTYSLDESKLRTAFNGDFDSTSSALSALVAPVLTWAKDNDATTGTVFRAKDGATSTSTDIANQIDAYNVRLTATEARFRKQFTDLETALGQLKSQSTWLSGQLASLPTNG